MWVMHDIRHINTIQFTAPVKHPHPPFPLIAHPAVGTCTQYTQSTLTLKRDTLLHGVHCTCTHQPVFSPGPFSRVAPYAFHTSFPLRYHTKCLMWSQTTPTREPCLQYSTVYDNSPTSPRICIYNYVHAPL